MQGQSSWFTMNMYIMVSCDGDHITTSNTYPEGAEQRNLSLDRFLEIYLDVLEKS